MSIRGGKSAADRGTESSSNGSASRRRHAALVLLLVLLAVALRLYRIDRDSFWIDELHQVRVASQAPLDILRNYHPAAPRELRDQAPLSLLVTHLTLRESNPELSARLPSAVFGTLGVLALFLLARQFLPFGPAWTAAFLLALSPLDVWYGQEARWYAQWSLFVVLSYLALVRAAATDSWKAWLAYVVVSVANVYTFVFSIFVMAAQGISLWWRHRGSPGNEALRHFALAGVMVLVAAGPVVAFVFGSLTVAQSGTPRAASLLELPYTLYAYAVGYTLGPTLAELHFEASPIDLLTAYPEVPVVMALFLALTCLGIVELFSDRRAAVWLMPWLFGLPLMVFSVTLVTDLTYQVRYTLASLPAFMVVLALGVSSLRWRWRAMGTALVAIPVSLSLANLYTATRYDRADVRRALAHIVERDPEVSEVVVVGQVELAIPYFGRFPTIDAIGGCGSEAGLAVEFEEPRTVWVLAGRDWERRSGRCLEELTASFYPAEHQSGTGVELWRFEPRPASE